MEHDHRVGFYGERSEDGRGRAFLLLAVFLWPLTTHPFEEWHGMGEWGGSGIKGGWGRWGESRANGRGGAVISGVRPPS